MADIVCVGYACADVFVRGLDLSGSFSSETTHCQDIKLAVGGDAANESIVIAHMGGNVKLISGVGDDGIASYIENTLQKANVDTSALHYTQMAESAATIVVVHPNGQRNFIAVENFAPSAFFEPDPIQFHGATIVSLGSMFLPPIMTADSIRGVVRAAKAENSIICADVVCNNKADTLENIKDILCDIDYIFPNEDEARALTGETNLDKIADVFLDYGVKNVVIKVGKDGCFFKNASECFLSPCIGPKGIDTTGAGDNFAAGFILAMNEGKNNRECCKFAAGVAGVACQFMGANIGVKSREQVEQFIKQYEK